MITCLHCGATTSNGLALCDLCQRGVRLNLEYLPVYFRNLARWRRPGRPNGALGARGQWLIRQGESDTESIGRALDRAGNDLTTWARALADDRGGIIVKLLDRLNAADISEAQTVAWICRGFDRYLTSVATLEWAGQFVRDIDRHARALLALTEDYVPGWYAGSCRQCAHPTHVVPGLTWVTCGACGATTYARDHLDTVLAEARGWVAPPKRLAEAIVALVDIEQSVERLHDRIRKWNQLGWLPARRRKDADGDEFGPKRYLMGDVLDLVFGQADAPTRAQRMTTA